MTALEFATMIKPTSLSWASHAAEKLDLPVLGNAIGLKAANYPLTEEDLDSPQLPSLLKKHKSKLFGLTIDPIRLQAIREQRRPGSRYASPHQCHFEVGEVEAMFRREGVPHIATTDQSVEEISSQVLTMTGLKRRYT